MTYNTTVHLPPILSKPSYVFPDKPLPPINNHIQSYSVSLYNNNDLRILSKFNFIDTLSSPSPAQNLDQQHLPYQQYQLRQQSPHPQQQYQPYPQAYVHPSPSPSSLSPSPSTASLPGTHSSTASFSSPSSATTSAATTAPKRKKKTSKTYTCHCNRSFTTSGHLARHMRIHTGEKNYTCPYAGCFARFSRQDNCMQHYRTHLGSNTRPRTKGAAKQKKVTTAGLSALASPTASVATTSAQASVSPIAVQP